MKRHTKVEAFERAELERFSKLFAQSHPELAGGCLARLRGAPDGYGEFSTFQLLNFCRDEAGEKRVA